MSLGAHLCDTRGPRPPLASPTGTLDVKSERGSQVEEKEREGPQVFTNTKGNPNCTITQRDLQNLRARGRPPQTSRQEQPRPASSSPTRAPGTYGQAEPQVDMGASQVPGRERHAASRWHRTVPLPLLLFWGAFLLRVAGFLLQLLPEDSLAPPGTARPKPRVPQNAGSSMSSLPPVSPWLITAATPPPHTHTERDASDTNPSPRWAPGRGKAEVTKRPGAGEGHQVESPSQAASSQGAGAQVPSQAPRDSSA